MSAPPIPPKRNSNSWMSQGTVIDQLNWTAESQNSFSENASISQINNNQIRAHFYDNSHDQSQAPPIPPRPVNKVQPYQKPCVNEINELTLIPPPPGVGQLYRRTNNFQSTFSNSNSFSQSFFNSGNFKDATTPKNVLVSNAKFESQSSNFTHRGVTPQISQPLAFSNYIYQGNFNRPSTIPPGFEIHHSRSAPNMLDCPVPESLRNHRYSISYNDNNPPPRTVYSTINHNASTVSNQNTQANLENILKFMKKRSDSNLIDLYCGEDTQLSQNLKTKSQEDLLRLFDPLSNDDSKAPNIQERVEVKTIQPDLSTSTKTSVEEKSVALEIDKTRCDNECATYVQNKVEDIVLQIIPNSQGCKKEVKAFCQKLQIMRSAFSYDDILTNPGLVISPTLDSYRENSLSIKLVIMCNSTERPVSFTCDVSTSIEHIISHTVCTIFDDTTSICMDDFVLKVHGFSEYFTADSALSNYEYVHQCHKFDKPVFLTLIKIKDLKRPLARNKTDDYNDSTFKLSDVVPAKKGDVISYENLSILLDTLEKEIEKIHTRALNVANDSVQPQGVVQAVKAICTLLSHIETTEITHTVASFIQVCLLFDKSDDFDTLPELEQLSTIKANFKECKDHLDMFCLLELSLFQLKQAIHELLVMYTKIFNVNFELHIQNVNKEEKLATEFLDALLFEVGVIHQIQPSMLSQYESYFLVCEIQHGGTTLVSLTSKTAVVTKSFFSRIVFDEWLQFENLSLCSLTRESILYFTLWGLSSNNTDSKQSGGYATVKTQLGWCGIRLFSYEGDFVQGSFLLGIWPNKVLKDTGPLLSNPASKCSLLNIKLPEFEYAIKFPLVINSPFPTSQLKAFESLSHDLQMTLKEIIEKDALTPLTLDEKELLWEKRYFLHKFPSALPKVLLSAHGWDWACLPDIYILLKAWTPAAPVKALHLLLPCFPDHKVRTTAVSWIKSIVNDELCDYLPQIVQILRYEPWEDSPLAWFLLERSLKNVRVAHQLYWLLKQNINDPIVGERMHLMLNALLAISGQAMRSRIKSEEALLQNLSTIADKIKTTKESLRLSSLLHELETTHYNLVEDPTFLPLSPSFEVSGIDVKSCSYFTSNTLPLRLNFIPEEKDCKNHEVIFKVGDDLRQDMLTLQMIRIMNKLWLKEGLDLKIVTFACVATDYKKGMVEIVPESETLRKIQTELGLTGSFKDRPIAEWLQKYNTSELEYQQAVENFTLSCAGYCVATYILGICDRHNDNIMLKTSGHIFHIDFGRFLGDSQMFGSIKRDRTPFVLTSDMAFVINGGDKPSKKFQYFIDLCCQAFNIIRNNKNIFFNLFTFMESSDIQGLSSSAVNYIQNALLPNMSEAEATVRFTHMIQESLKSWFTQFNFFIHNLAQLRFTGDHNEGLLLSFIPKSFSKESDGKVESADVIGYKKMYDPEKYYIYVVKVKRFGQPDPMCIFRTYREFIEFQQKLCMMFPLSNIKVLSGNPLMSRTNVREVAERRKNELCSFLSSLMSMAQEISHSDLVYTFLHPLLRDQEGMIKENEVKKYSPRSRRSSSLGAIEGQIKLSIVYKNNSLFIMIIHAKNLTSSKGTAPDPYVKTYLLPDPNKMSKRKTKTVSKSCHPTFMEMLVYKTSLVEVKHKALHVSVWDYDRVQENEFLGAALIPLSGDLSKEKVQWYPLGQFNN